MTAWAGKSIPVSSWVADVPVTQPMSAAGSPTAEHTPKNADATALQTMVTTALRVQTVDRGL
jgi:hypothetical protein